MSSDTIPSTLTISTRIDSHMFFRFAVFDVFTHQKRWKRPALFSVIMLAFACVCFLMAGKREHAVLLGAVLAGIALVLPAVYFGTYFYSVRQQAKRLGLKTPHYVYTVSLQDRPDGITINSAKKEDGTLRHRWDLVHKAYRVKGCIYFYLSPRRAFLLPDGQANVSADQLWDFLGKHLTAEQMKDCR